MTSDRKQHRNHTRPAKGTRPGKPFGYVAVAGVFLAVGAAIWWGTGLDPGAGRQEADPDRWGFDPASTFDARVYAAYGGTASCRECHQKEDDLWRPSNHALAERLPDADLDRRAFVPPRSFTHGTQTSEIRLNDGRCQIVTVGYQGRKEPYVVQRIIGHDPLRQFLVAGPGGRLQTLETSYDPKSNEWFNVYGQEDRKPGEWGHWTGRGMTWNSMCAYCHNTRLDKNYDETTDSYRTTMAEMGVGCEACHGPMKDHAEWRRAYPDPATPDPTIRPQNAFQILYACAPCHSRRLELTGQFVPGEHYFDHFSLVTVDESDLYYPDGQVRGENYVFASFLSSRMYAAGVRCLDCHDPHSLETRYGGNDLCMRCHNGGYVNSPIIDPAGHGFHKLDDTGGQCVGCHMPHTVYMERHPRRDHGYIIPDPLLTRELGIPNACNRCHADKDVDWSIQTVEEWYGPRMDRYTRRRARWIAAARQGVSSARESLLGLLQGDDLPYWKGVAARLLGRWITDSPVQDALLRQLDLPDPLVRASAVTALEPLVQDPQSPARGALRRLLEDPMRVVRFRAAWALRDELAPGSKVANELAQALDFNADQPGGQVQKGVYALARGNQLIALDHYRKAVSWDPYSGGLREEWAVVLSMAGRTQEALEQMQEACRLEPEQPEFHFRLALAWNEVGRLDRTLESLERTVALDSSHARAWYNLGLARHTVGLTESALEAMAQAEAADPRDPRIPYARATILAQQGRSGEAREAAERALRLEPGFEAAQELLESLAR